jgi:hypothetical protein
MNKTKIFRVVYDDTAGDVTANDIENYSMEFNALRVDDLTHVFAEMLKAMIHAEGSIDAPRAWMEKT